MVPSGGYKNIWFLKGKRNSNRDKELIINKMIINNTMTINSTINSLLEALIVIGPLLGSIAYVTIAERKIMGSMQRRIGPNKVGYYGLLQAFADALKLLNLFNNLFVLFIFFLLFIFV